MNEQLAIIENAEVRMVYDGKFLGLSLTVKYEEGCHQDILGGTCLYNPGREKDQCSYPARLMCEVLSALKIESFKEAKGKFIKVLGEGSGFDFKPSGFKSMAAYGNEKTVLFELTDKEKKAIDKESK